MFENSLSFQSLNTSWFPLLFDISLKGLVILFTAAAFCSQMRKMSSAARHLIWSLALFSLLALPPLTILLPEWQAPLFPQPGSSLLASISGQPADALSYSTSEIIDRQMNQPEIMPPNVSNLPVYTDNFYSPLQNRIFSDIRAAVPAATGQSFHWLTLILILWSAGASVVFVRMTIGLFRVWWVKRYAQPITDISLINTSHTIAKSLGIKRRFALLKSAGSRVPMTLGLLKPVVLLPASMESWSQQRRKVVLQHELSHIKRFDTVYNVLSQAAAALYWFNPLVWYALRRLYIERENACDDYVLAAGTKATDYAHHLLEIAQKPAVMKRLFPAGAAFARKSKLEDRLMTILNEKQYRNSMKRSTILLTVVLAASFVVPLACLQPWSKKEKPVEEIELIAEDISDVTIEAEETALSEEAAALEVKLKEEREATELQEMKMKAELAGKLQEVKLKDYMQEVILKDYMQEVKLKDYMQEMQKLNEAVALQEMVKEKELEKSLVKLKLELEKLSEAVEQQEDIALDTALELEAVQADTIYVHPVNGDDDSGDGSKSKPYKTIARALQAENLINESIVVKTGGEGFMVIHRISRSIYDISYQPAFPPPPAPVSPVFSPKIDTTLFLSTRLSFDSTRFSPLQTLKFAQDTLRFSALQYQYGLVKPKPVDVPTPLTAVLPVQGSRLTEQEKELFRTVVFDLPAEFAADSLVHNVVISIYNLLGERIREFDRSSYNAGDITFTWDGKDDKGIEVESGVYIARLQTQNFTQSKRIIVFR